MHILSCNRAGLSVVWNLLASGAAADCTSLLHVVTVVALVWKREMINSVKSIRNQAKEAEENLQKTQEELHMVMMAPPPPPPPPMYDHLEDNSDSEENASTHSADLPMHDINDHRHEEERITEAEKNERVQKQLKVRAERYRVASSPNFSIRHLVLLLEVRWGGGGLNW